MIVPFFGVSFFGSTAPSKSSWAGCFPPSYQVNFTGGSAPRAGNSYLMMLHFGKVSQFQCPVSRIHVVATHVAERAGSEIPPASPIERKVSRMVRTLRRRAEPQV